MALTKEQIQQIAAQTRSSFESGSFAPTGVQCLFDDVHDAIDTAIRAQHQLMDMSLEERGKLIEAMRVCAREHAEELAILAHEETGYGKVPHKIAKNLLAANKTPGIEDLHPTAFSGDNGLTLVETAPYGVIGAITPSTNPTATIINMLGSEIGISFELGALIACVVFMVYTATSGLFGVIYTDVFQFVMLILFVYIMIPSASVMKLGGFSVFLENLAPELAKPYIDGSILSDIITYFVFTLAGAEMWQRAFAAKSRRAAKEGLFLGTFVYGLTIPLVWFMGVITHQLVSADKIAQYGSTDAVVPALAIEVLPVGLTGLALAGILSVIMSTADSYLIVSVQTCVHDIYKVFPPNIPEKKELRLTRVFAIVLPLGALVIALYIKNAYNILMFAWSFYAAAAGLPAFAALYWKKATKAGIISGMAAGFTVCVGWKLAGTPFGLGPTVPGAIACAAALVIVSLATYKKAPTRFLDPYEEERKQKAQQA